MQNNSDVDAYINRFRGEPKIRLEQVQKLISEQLPDEAVEKISYGIPTIYLNGNLIHYAAYNQHIGLYPGSAPIKELAPQLKDYKTSKGTIQIPYDQPLPTDLILTILSLCIERNLSKKSK